MIESKHVVSSNKYLEIPTTTSSCWFQIFGISARNPCQYNEDPVGIRGGGS